jgi:hypothetical protein
LGALQDLRAHLQAEEVPADPLQIGAVLLALARAKHWNEKPETLVDWLEELALDVARNWRHAEMEQAGVDTVPISELKKIAEALRQHRPPPEKP